MIGAIQAITKNLRDVEIAFETRAIFDCSIRELEEFLAAIAAGKIPDQVERAHASAMSQTIRELLAQRRLEQTLRRKDKSNRAAFAFALLALACSAAQLIYFWAPTFRETKTQREDFSSANLSPEIPSDMRTHLTVAELAHLAPSIRKGSLQAWWAGEQARQIEQLESLARKQTLGGDLDGARRSAERADTIRASLDQLADFEKPPAK